MQEAKLFTNGRSQAVRLPKEFRFQGDSVCIKRVGKAVVLLPKEDPFAGFFEALTQFSPDFLEKRDQPAMQQREDLF
ncbi:MAG TPA: type II toxin-antitoxin system VapB family antitoxin [Solidesulfovibrio magneticus]|nr:type II toxin-antitoxin system VapB family antitoxin [Solidesulfovibrio magneticus]